MHFGQVYVGHMSVRQLLSVGQIPVNQSYSWTNGIWHINGQMTGQIKQYVSQMYLSQM